MRSVVCCRADSEQEDDAAFASDDEEGRRVGNGCLSLLATREVQ